MSINPVQTALQHTLQVGKRLQQWRRYQNLALARQLVSEILPAVPPMPALPPPTSWRIQQAKYTSTGVVVIRLGLAQMPTVGILKVAQSAQGGASLKRQALMLARLHNDPRLEPWRRLIPRPIQAGEVQGQAYSLEQALPGQEAAQLLGSQPGWQPLHAGAAELIGQLHAMTSRSTTIDNQHIERWVEQPLRLLQEVRPCLVKRERRNAALNRLALRLRATLVGKTLVTSWIHGDYWPGNLLVDPLNQALLGIVDWDMSAPDDLPFHDLFHLVLYTRSLVQRRDLGEIVREKLLGSPWTEAEQQILCAGGMDLSQISLSEQSMLLLYWLRHIAANLTQDPAYASHYLWIYRNIESVLECL